LHAAGLETVDPPGDYQLTPADLDTYLPGAAAVIAGMEPYTEDLLSRCPELRVIARTGVGYDAVDVEAATRHGVVLAITPGTNQDSVAEQAFALLLGVSRRVALNDRIIRSGGWDRALVMPLRGKTLGLFGLGRIGRAMVPRAHAFGMSVLAADPFLPTSAEIDRGVRLVDFDTLVAASDVLSVHCPLTPETRGLFNARVFGRMKPGSLLLNTARGGVVNEPDLHQALVHGPLAGAGLDVLECEPPRPDNPLFMLDNVVISPHIAGIDTRAMADMAEKAAWCITTLRKAGWPEDCVVNHSLAPHWQW
jgi:phosphoglycerate dehydrogenase-like enzyme